MHFSLTQVSPDILSTELGFEEVKTYNWWLGWEI